jgi:3-oxoadipate enol-lactonase
MPRAEFGNLRLHYEIDGPTDGPVLVLSHSIGTTTAMWTHVAPEFARRFRVLNYDTRGHGESNVPEGPYTIADLGSDVLALLDALNIRRCTFCGLSLGGMTGIWLGIHAPDRLHTLILANTAAHIGTQESWNARIRAVQQGGMAAIADAVMERWFTRQFRQNSPGTVAPVRQMFLDTSPKGYVACCAAIRDADFTPDLKAIPIPTLVITGRVDPATTPDDGQVVVQNISGARYVELETAHLSAVENPAGFSAAVLGLASHMEA